MRAALLGCGLAVLVSAGCFKGDFRNCVVTCASSADCPSDLACSPQGLCSTGGSTCTPVMVDADLTMPQPLTATVTGDGVITSDPAGIDCGATCSDEFPPLSSVTLTATPGTNAVFDGWGGDCAGTDATCALTMDGAKTASAQFALHGARRWVQQVGFSGQDFVDGELDVDAMGNAVVAGSFDDNGTPGFFIAKYSGVDGQQLWQQKIDAPSFFFIGGGVDTDADGNVYACARLQGNGALTVGTSTVTGDIFGNVFAIRLAGATGAIEWAKTWGGTGQELCEGIAVSGDDVFITGYTSSNPSTFDGITFAASTNNAFVARAARATGLVTAGKHLAGNFQINDIAAANGEAAVVGSFRGTFNVDACNLSSTQTGTDGMIMKFANNLSCSWSRGFGSNTANENTVTNAVAPAPGGDWVIAGSYQGFVNLAMSGSSMPFGGGTDAFLGRFGSTGSFVYQFGYGNADGDQGRGVDVTPTGEVVFAGTFGSTITLGTFTLTGANDIFVTRLSAGPTPVHQWVFDLGATAGEFLTGLNVDQRGTVSLFTSWTGMTDVAGVPLTAQDYDGYVASFVR